MINESKNKAIGKEAVTKESLAVLPDVEKSFFFPDYGVTIKATSKEEAEQKLLEIIKQ